MSEWKVVPLENDDLMDANTGNRTSTSGGHYNLFDRSHRVGGLIRLGNGATKATPK